MAPVTRGRDEGELEVELVDVDDLTRDADAVDRETPPRAAHDDPGAPGEPVRRPRRRRRPARRVVQVAVVVAALVGIGVAQLVETAARPTAGVVSGLVGSVPEAPEELWRAAGAFWSFVDGDVVVHGDGRAMVARGARSGAVVTETTSDEGTCMPASDLLGEQVVTSVVLCHEGPTIAEGEGVMVLRAVRPADGRMLWERTASADRWDSLVHLVPGDDGARRPAAAATVVDADGVDVLWAVRDGSVARVLRLGLADGEIRWAADLDGAAGDGLWLETRGDTVAVGGRAVVDLDTGEHVPAADAPTAATTVSFRVPRGTALLEWSPEGMTTTVVALDGTERFSRQSVHPAGWRAVVSDRADVLVVAGGDGGPLVLDVETGAELWRIDGEIGIQDVVAYLPGTLVVRSGGELRGFDPRTGEQRWAVPTDPESWATVAVDDRRLLAPARLPGGGAGLQAVDIATGDVAWTVPLPSRVQELRAADGVLVVQMDSGVIAFAAG